MPEDATRGARPRGTRLAVDVGTVRVGVAASDPEGLMAFPVATVHRGPKAPGEVASIARERGAEVVYVGLPLTLAGHEGASANDARSFAEALAERLDTPVRLIDERLTTVTASAALREAGRDARRQREVVDQAAAVVILENALDTERRGTADSVTHKVPREGNDD